MAPPDDKTANRRFVGRYEILRHIGRGSQATVELGRDPALGRYVAIKILDGVAAGPTAIGDDGVPLEVRITGGLKHPNIVPLLDAGETEGLPYLVFDYVEGMTLAERLGQAGAISLEDVVPIVAGTLAGVAAAHDAHVLHLDLNPRNIMIDANNVPRVLDFGLSQYVHCATGDDDNIRGTLNYLAPEHLLGRPLGSCTDVFALGCTFYELVTGCAAIGGNTPEQVQINIVGGIVDFEAVRGLQHGEAFVRFLQGALERDPEGRYANAAVMAEAFNIFLAETGLGSVGASPGQAHGTIEFLLQRMQCEADFPIVSRRLSEIHRVSGANCAEQLAGVIRRDTVLASRLLSLVNSAHRGGRTREFCSVAEAVALLGTEPVRSVATTLAVREFLAGDSTLLQESLARSLLSAFVARGMARHLGLPGAEEALVAGFCQNLGEHLAIAYFPEAYDDILGRQAGRNLAAGAAARGVLGVSLGELGHAVARAWCLPSPALAAARGLPPGPVREPASAAEALCNVAIFANALCRLFELRSDERLQAELNWLRRQFEQSVHIEAAHCVALISAGFQELTRYAPAFGISVAGSACCRAAGRRLERLARKLPPESRAPAEQGAAPAGIAASH